MKTNFSIVKFIKSSYNGMGREIDVIPIERKEKISFSTAINGAIGKVSNGWVVLLLENQELKSDFFDVVEHNIESFYEIEGNERFVFVGQTLYGDRDQKKWEDCVRTANPTRYLDFSSNSFSHSFIVFPLDLFSLLNGFDERYDSMNGFEKYQFFHRVQASGYRIIFDRLLMGYASSESVANDISDSILYSFESSEINNGKIRASNYLKNEN